MKRISFLIISFFFIYCKQETKNPHLVVNMVQKNIHSEEAIKMLKDFYLNFYSSDEPLDKKKSMKDFVSSRVLKRIDSLTKNPENLIIDYDPFIKGQDYNGESIKKSLEIKPLKNDDEYRISFLQFGEKDEARTNIDVLVKKDDSGKLLIYSIINDHHLNFK
ncbi:DUF3828 domain-containing protein [uncultured Chryseobacterium sp.]|uniref:DUF3828 domain-containing protein n=1 Tax=uncultured Chryseobacterium sp. TaxID=259322 RepID=UPI0025CF230E|nr:DUF3828 domain-containing protein [uncultured Chryseobacterium sp.]